MFFFSRYFSTTATGGCQFRFSLLIVFIFPATNFFMFSLCIDILLVCIWYLSAHRNRRSLVSSSKLPFLSSLLLRVCKEISHSPSSIYRVVISWNEFIAIDTHSKKRNVVVGTEGFHFSLWHTEWLGDNYNILYRQINKRKYPTLSLSLSLLTHKVGM